MSRPWFTRERTARTIDGVEYAPGARFEVLAPCRLLGWGPVMNSASRGWSQELAAGDVIECTGFGAGWGSDPGFGVEWTTERSRADGAGYLELHPSVGGAFSYHPAPGLLRRIEEEP